MTTIPVTTVADVNRAIKITKPNVLSGIIIALIKHGEVIINGPGSKQTKLIRKDL